MIKPAHSMAGAIKNIFVSLMLLGLVVSLFFIPELISVYRSFSSGSSKSTIIAHKAASKEQSSEIEVKKVSKETADTNLDKIFNLVSDGYLENPSGEQQAKASLNPQSLDPKVIQNLGDKGITWELISTNAVRNAFRDAQRNAATILKTIPEKNQQTRFALISFINGTGWIQRAEKSSTSAEKALAYIEQLDTEVTMAMIRESVDRSDFIAWSKVSLGPLLSGSRAIRMKSRMEMPFNPRLTLASVELRRPPRSEYSKYFARGRPIPTLIRVSGFIIGKDTNKLVLIKNGRRATRISLKAKPDDEGKRMFRFSANRGEGLFTLRAVDKDGNIVDNIYSFFPRADLFPRRKNNSLMLPIRSVTDPKDFSFGEVDPRLDRFFKVASSSPQQSSSNSNFERF